MSSSGLNGKQQQETGTRSKNFGKLLQQPPQTIPQQQFPSEFAAKLANDRSLFPYELAGGLTARAMEAFLSGNLNSSKPYLTNYNYINTYASGSSSSTGVRNRFEDQPDYKYFMMQMANEI